MEIVLNRRAGVPVRQQLVAQLELRILSGEIAPGEKLPSVRSFARRLRLHPNTVSAAYRALEATGHVRLRKGAGVFVRAGALQNPTEARDLDEMMRASFEQARARGFSRSAVRAAVERWLRAAPAERVVAVDRSRAMAELLGAEARGASRLPVEARSLAEVEREPALLSGCLVVTLPYHVDAVRARAPLQAIEVVNLEIPPDERAAILGLPAGALAVVVSHSETVLPFATTLFHSLRGDEVLVEAHTLADVRSWRRVLPAADVVFADVLAASEVRSARPRQLREFRIVDRSALRRIGAATRAAARG
jgi:DNA-binding transcriptional regulator YhcF (GntR family)